jgi:hypothetical protein
MRAVGRSRLAPPELGSDFGRRCFAPGASRVVTKSDIDASPLPRPKQLVRLRSNLDELRFADIRLIERDWAVPWSNSGSPPARSVLMPGKDEGLDGKH